MQKSEKSSTSKINSISRALELIELLHKSNGELGISEIASAMNEYKSTIHRTLATLEEYGFVVQNPDSTKYGLGPKMYAIATAADKQFILRETVRPFADKILERFQETVNVAAIDDYSDSFKFLIVYRAEGKDKVLRMNSRAMSNSDVYCSSLGKSLLANTLNFELIASKINYSYHTKNTITSAHEFIEHLYEVKEKGYSLDDEELEIGLTCVGVPIFNSTGKIILAISVSGPTSRIVNKIDTIVAELKKTSQQISALL